MSKVEKQQKKPQQTLSPDEKKKLQTQVRTSPLSLSPSLPLSLSPSLSLTYVLVFLAQLCFYFSDANLRHDGFLKGEIDRDRDRCKKYQEFTERLQKRQ
jgi:hypothetical protein